MTTLWYRPRWSAGSRSIVVGNQGRGLAGRGSRRIARYRLSPRPCATSSTNEGLEPLQDNARSARYAAHPGASTTPCARPSSGQALRPRSVASGAASGSCCSPVRIGYPGGSRKTSRRSGWAGHRTMAWTNQTGEARRSDLAT